MSSGEPHDELAADRKQTRRTMLTTLGAGAIGALGIGGAVAARSSAFAGEVMSGMSEVATDAAPTLLVAAPIDESSVELSESGTGVLQRYAVEISGAVDRAALPSSANPDVVIAQGLIAGDRVETARMPIGVTQASTFRATLESDVRFLTFDTVRLGIRLEDPDALPL